jgi:hypothetical protein
MFYFKAFQKSDLARAAIPDGAILAADCGTGKTCMSIAWALMKVGFHREARGTLLPGSPVLIVCGSGLMDQMIADYKNLFGSAMPPVTIIRNQAHFASILAHRKGHLAPGWYMASYQAVAMNKFQLLPLIPDGDLAANEVRAYTTFFGVTTIEECRTISSEGNVGIGAQRNGIMCVYRPALAELMRDRFGAVIIDEAVHCKSEDSILGIGVRRLNPRYRLISTATPAKNRLTDILFLAAWSADALDQANDRWAYPAYSLSAFMEDFQVTSLDLTMDERRRASPGHVTVSKQPSKRDGLPIAEVCNVHKLWRTLAPAVLRRRKSDISEQEIVSKTHRVIEVPLGSSQAKAYQHFLTTPAFDRRGNPAVGQMISSLRLCAACPTAESLGKWKSDQSFTPKLHAALEVIRAVLRRKEQVVLFSPFHAPLDILSGYLSECGIPHNVLDGRLNANKRAVLAAQFKQGLNCGANPVLLAGCRACAEGYSWPLCNNVILYSEEFALDVMRQAINRVHRINSPKPVTVWSLIVKASIETVMHAMQKEKGDAADIALDGAPGIFQTDEMTMEQVIEMSKVEFAKDGFVDESVALAEWPALRKSISDAWQAQQVQVVGRAA